jgi:hypothetical protein
MEPIISAALFYYNYIFSVDKTLAQRPMLSTEIKWQLKNKITVWYLLIINND